MFNKNKKINDLFDYIVQLKPELIDNSDMRKRRIKKFKSYLNNNYSASSNGRILVVSHGVFIMKFCNLKKCPGNAAFNHIAFKIE